MILLFAGTSMTCLSQTTTKKADLAYFCQLCNSHCDTIAYAKAGTCTHCGMPLLQQSKALRKKELEKKMKVCFYLQDGVEVLDFAGPMEVFSYAGFEVFTVSKTKDPIVSQGIVKVIPDYSIKDAPPADILAFFGGNAGQSFDDEVVGWIKSRQSQTKYFFSVCTGAFALGKAGLLDGLTVTTFHDAIDALRRQCPKAKVLSDVRWVDNGKVITTAGISAGIDGALHLVSKFYGDDAAKRTAYYMEYDKWIPKQGMITTPDDNAR